MRIALLTQYYKPEIGAPQNRLYEMLSGLKRSGNEVYVVTSMPNYPTGRIFPEYAGKISMVETVDDIPTKRFWLYASNSKNKIGRIWNMISFSIISLLSARFLKKHNLDYIIVESPPLTLPITGYILTKITGAKLITNISDLWPLSAVEIGAISKGGSIDKVLQRLERFIYRKSHICMGQSEEICAYIRDHGGTDVYLFRNGVDPSRFDNIPDTSDQNACPKIVYAGLLGFAQGIYSICQNIDFRALGVEFHLYGAGGEQQDIEEFIVQNPNKGIYYHGKVSREQIPQILRSANATLVPLKKHILGAVPSKIYESMAAGIPIIFSGEGEGEKIIKRYNLGWTSPAHDFEKMRANIRKLTSNPDDLSKKKNNCIECANNVFNRPKQIHALNDYLLKHCEEKAQNEH